MCVLSSALDKDNEVIRYVRAKYRNSRFNTARSHFLSTGPGYAPVGQEPRHNINPESPLKREVAWKKLAGDVFRRPFLPMILSVLFGSGMQILALIVILLVSTFAGTLSSFHLQVVSGLVLYLFPACGIINGFCAGRLYAFLHGAQWQGLALLTSMFVPAIFTICMAVVDTCEYIETGRTQAVTLSEGLALGFLFIVVNLPATFLGTVWGYKMRPIRTSTKVSRVPRDAPAGLPWFLNFNLMSMIGGMVPVLVIGFELYQILYCIRGTSYIYLLYWSFYVGFLVFLIVVA